MNDSLRDRIAAALQAADEDWITYTNPYQDMADAVIAELDLTKEFGCNTDDRHGCRCSHRYTTNWRRNNID